MARLRLNCATTTRSFQGLGDTTPYHELHVTLHTGTIGGAIVEGTDGRQVHLRQKPLGSSITRIITGASHEHSVRRIFNRRMSSITQMLGVPKAEKRVVSSTR